MSCTVLCWTSRNILHAFRTSRRKLPPSECLAGRTGLSCTRVCRAGGLEECPRYTWAWTLTPHHDSESYDTSPSCDVTLHDDVRNMKLANHVIAKWRHVLFLATIFLRGVGSRTIVFVLVSVLVFVPISVFVSVCNATRRNVKLLVTTCVTVRYSANSLHRVCRQR